MSVTRTEEDRLANLKELKDVKILTLTGFCKPQSLTVTNVVQDNSTDPYNCIT